MYVLSFVVKRCPILVFPKSNETKRNRNAANLMHQKCYDFMLFIIGLHFRKYARNITAHFLTKQISISTISSFEHDLPMILFQRLRTNVLECKTERWIATESLLNWSSKEIKSIPLTAHCWPSKWLHTSPFYVHLILNFEFKYQNKNVNDRIRIVLIAPMMQAHERRQIGEWIDMIGAPTFNATMF